MGGGEPQHDADYGLNSVAGKVCTTAGDELQQDRRAKFLLQRRIWCERSLMGLNEMPSFLFKPTT